jgi:hypothetical protein
MCDTHLKREKYSPRAFLQAFLVVRNGIFLAYTLAIVNFVGSCQIPIRVTHGIDNVEGRQPI